MLKYILSLFIFLLPITSFAYSFITKVVDGHKVRIFVVPHDDMYRVTTSISNTGVNLKNLVEKK